MNNILADVPQENNFWVCNGAVLKNVQELQNALQSMNEETYSRHANTEKNDFANWVNDILRDAGLANKLRSAKSRQDAAKLVAKAVKRARKK